MDIDIETWLTGGAILALLMASAFCSGSETALVAASRARMHGLEQDGNRSAAIVNRLVGDQDRLISSILLGNNFVNILASALATGFLIDVFGDAGVAYATFGMTILILIFGEVLPKTIAINRPNRTALFVARPVSVLVALVSPINGAVQGLVAAMLRLLGITGRRRPDEDIAHQELRGAIDLHHKEGAVVKGDRDMLGGILDLRDLEVSDVMVHRTKIEAVCGDDPPGKIVDDALRSEYTRVPVWSGDPDNFIGIINVKDLLRALHAVDWDVGRLDLKALYSPPWFVPDTTGLKPQLNQFLKRKSHFALVVDEYGEVEGLVTLEDILEEIVGQISDEHDDMPDQGIRPQSDGRIVVDGSVPIRDLNRHLDWHLPDEEATTIAGLVIHEAQSIPDAGQVFTFYDYRFEVIKKSRNRITMLRIAPIGETRADGHE
jgi:Mg2+/Co2+ transporter CorB